MQCGVDRTQWWCTVLEPPYSCAAAGSFARERLPCCSHGWCMLSEAVAASQSLGTQCGRHLAHVNCRTLEQGCEHVCMVGPAGMRPMMMLYTRMCCTSAATCSSGVMAVVRPRHFVHGKSACLANCMCTCMYVAMQMCVHAYVCDRALCDSGASCMLP